MTLEILIQNTEPGDGTSGTSLTNTRVINIVPPKFSGTWERKTAISGKPLQRWKGSKAPTVTIELIILETGTTNLTTASLGLVDLDVLRKAESGYDGASTKGLLVWLRDTESDYWLRHWKGGYIRSVTPKRIQGYQHQIGSALFKVTIAFDAVFTGGDVHHQLLRW